MYKKPSMLRLVPLAIGAAAIATSVQAGGDRNHDEEEEELEFGEAQLYLELNDTDGDLGIHGLVDGDAWKSLEIEDHRERVLLTIWVRSALRRQGMTEIFFESAEPDFEEQPPAVFFKRFPEGTYEISGVTLEGDELEGEVDLSHTLAGPPADVTVNDEAAAVNCDATLPVVSEPITISWSPVTMSHPTLGNTGVPVTVLRYELVAEIERDGQTPDLLVFTATLPPDVTSFELPEDFTGLADGEMKFEIVTKLDNGNQTALESCYEIE